MKDKTNRQQVGTYLDANLYRQIKARSILEGRTAGELIDDAIRAFLGKADPHTCACAPLRKQA